MNSDFFNVNNEEELTRGLQMMLRSLSRWTEDPALNVAADGNYDEGTREAVRHFQRRYRLPVTGEPDFRTWTAIIELYQVYEDIYGDAERIMPFPSFPEHKVKLGERSDLVLIIQIVLNELRRIYDSYGHLPQSGRYDIATSEAVREFQRAAGLDPTGEVNKATWNRMAQEYNSLKSRPE